ncbi:hypothetical protein [Halolamina salifodinae]|uniref:Uncharacterized protein n=1 Tax=Halolamina salifodinae TaxID=1202767 RepID=A0A8T4GWS7_9EURY|nr:hypothetical protein [Halolamina salifodinae]MBP1985748.1 hypothetical protein [Halolamina salifodinae]
MQRSRRAVLAAIPVALAGCGRSLRENTVPGGLQLRNSRSESATVAVRAALLPPLPSATDDDIGEVTATATPATPRDADLDPPDATGEYTVEPGEERVVPDFFGEPGRWGVEVVLDPDAEAASDRTRIDLYASLPGPTGADTVIVEITDDGITAEATTVDD